MKQYLDLVERVLLRGDLKQNRTGVDSISVFGESFKHDMRDGFPLLTTKSIGLKTVSAELEFFIRGLQDKRWLQQRGCNIWDEWSNPEVLQERLQEWYRDQSINGVPKDELKKEFDAVKLAYQQEITDLGPIYGVQWRNFGSTYTCLAGTEYDEIPHTSKELMRAPDGSWAAVNFSTGIDQLGTVVEDIVKCPTSRRLIVSAWNPTDLPRMALPPCHMFFQFNVGFNNVGNEEVCSEMKDDPSSQKDSRPVYLDLIWYQRSVDVALGLPFNIASYGLLLTLVARHCNLEPRFLTGSLGDTHIYKTHQEGLASQITRDCKPLPKLEIENNVTAQENPDVDKCTPAYFNMWEWEYDKYILNNYSHHPRIDFDIAV